MSERNIVKLERAKIRLQIDVFGLEQSVREIEAKRAQEYKLVARFSAQNLRSECESAAMNVAQLEQYLEMTRELLNAGKSMLSQIDFSIMQARQMTSMKEVNKHLNAIAKENNFEKVEKEIQAFKDSVKTAKVGAKMTSKSVASVSVDEDRLKQIMQDAVAYAQASAPPMPSVNAQPIADALHQRLLQYR